MTEPEHSVESLEARLNDDPLNPVLAKTVAEDAIAMYAGLRQAVRFALRCDQCEISGEHRSMLEAYMDKGEPEDGGEAEQGVFGEDT